MPPLEDQSEPQGPFSTLTVANVYPAAIGETAPPPVPVGYSTIVTTATAFAAAAGAVATALSDRTPETIALAVGAIVAVLQINRSRTKQAVELTRRAAPVLADASAIADAVSDELQRRHDIIDRLRPRTTGKGQGDAR